MYMKSAVLLSAMLAPPLAAQTAVPGNTVSGARTDKAEKKICRSIDATGSIFRTKVCHTRAEWTAVDNDNAQNTRDFTDHLPKAGSVSLR